MKSSPLTNARHEKYCQNRAQGMSQREAYLRAGYVAGNDKIAAANANKLERSTAEVRNRIMALKLAAAEEAVRRSAWGQEDILTKLREVYVAAMGDKSYTAANRALELSGKQHGMFADKVLFGNAADKALDNLTDAELRLHKRHMEAFERERAALRQEKPAAQEIPVETGPPAGETLQ